MPAAAHAMASPSPFEVSRVGNTYHADSQTTSSSYSGDLKDVVESATAELKSHGGGVITFLAGDFDLGPDWIKFVDVTDVTLEGQGIDVTTIRNNASASADTEPFSMTRSDRMIVRDMTIHAGGPPRSTSDVLDFDGGDDIVVERVKVTASRGRGIIFDGKDAGQTANNNIVRDCIVTDVPHDGIQLLASSDNVIENCTITNVGGMGIRMNRSSTSAAQPNKKSSDNIISNNLIDSSSSHGIGVRASDRNLITGNTVLNAQEGSGIAISDVNDVQCDDNIVEFNTATDNQSTKTQKYGLAITDPGCHCTLVGDNDFSGNKLGEIDDDGTDTIYGDPDPPSALTLSPTDDATLRPGRGPLGARSTLEVDASSVKDSVLRFDVNGVGSSAVSNATLRLYAVDGSTSGGSFVEMTNTSWNEDTITWANAPPGDGIALGSLGAVSAGNWYELDVTPLVTGDGPVAVRISSSNRNGADYVAKEGTSGLAAELVIELGGSPPDDSEPPSAPSNLVATNVQPTSVSMQWNAASDNVGVVAYDVYRDGGLLVSVGGGTTSYQDSSAHPDSAYAYVVRARDGAGNTSGASNTLNVVTPTASSQLVLSPTDDATIRANRPDRNLGSKTTLEVDASSEKGTLLRFDVAGVGSQSVVSATLRLHVVNASNDGGDWTSTSATNWSEDTVTWNTAPDADGVFLASLGSVRVGNWVALDVTALVSGDGVVSVRGSSPSNNGADYVSKEGAGGLAPELVVVLD